MPAQMRRIESYSGDVRITEADKGNSSSLGPESWACVDCGINTSPGMFNRAEMEKAIRTAEAMSKFTGEEWSIPQKITWQAEVYTVHDAVWSAAGMEPTGGCLCIPCLERRLGRTLTPEDFPRDRIFNKMPGTKRLLSRQGRI